MSDEYGSDFITIVDEDGTEFELEVLTSLEYNGMTYLAVTLAGAEDEDVEISILKSVEEDGEPLNDAKYQMVRTVEEALNVDISEYIVEFWGMSSGIKQLILAGDTTYDSYATMDMYAIPLTLEEIFIYEMGGADYAVRDIIL